MELLKEIEKSFPRIEKLFTNETLLEFLETEYGDLGKYNFGLGTLIRLKLLRPDRVLYKVFVQNDYTDKEKMSMKMIIEFHGCVAAGYFVPKILSPASPRPGTI